MPTHARTSGSRSAARMDGAGSPPGIGSPNRIAGTVARVSARDSGSPRRSARAASRLAMRPARSSADSTARQDCSLHHSGVAESTRRTFAPGLRGFYALCRPLGYPVAPFQRRIARAAFGPEREVGISLPRGHAKSTFLALLALHHVLTVPDASVYIGAGAREQARIIGRILQRYALHPALAGRLTIRHDELRLGDRRGPTVLRIVA